MCGYFQTFRKFHTIGIILKRNWICIQWLIYKQIFIFSSKRILLVLHLLKNPFKHNPHSRPFPWLHSRIKHHLQSILHKVKVYWKSKLKSIYIISFIQYLDEQLFLDGNFLCHNMLSIGRVKAKYPVSDGVFSAMSGLCLYLF